MILTEDHLVAHHLAGAIKVSCAWLWPGATHSSRKIIIDIALSQKESIRQPQSSGNLSSIANSRETYLYSISIARRIHLGFLSLFDVVII